MNKSVKLFKALGDETRLNIIKLLLNGKHCVCEIQPSIGVGQSTTSIHLKKLEEANIITHKKVGKKTYYSINNTNIKKILSILNIKPLKTKNKCIK